jgi:hypothetical protein
MSATKTKPMTPGEFADYAASISPEDHAKFNAMLAFVEETVRENCAKIVEEPLTDECAKPHGFCEGFGCNRLRRMAAQIREG